VTTAPRKPRQAPVEDGELERSEPNPASLEPVNDNVLLAMEGGEDPAEPLGRSGAVQGCCLG
jgi:hypothetical protein